MASSASLHIYNVQTKGVQDKSMVKYMQSEMATPPGQFIAVQAINVLKEIISG